MMSEPCAIKSNGTGKHGAQAVLEYLESAEYYCGADGTPREPSVFQGAGAEALGLAGKPIDRQSFERLLNGRHPTKKTKIVRNAGAANRKKLAWDLVNSPPKSFSILNAVAPREMGDKLDAILAHANAESLKHMESCLTIRTGRNGVSLEACAGLVVATVHHKSSRALDPDDHFHNVVANAGMRSDGSFGALDEAELREYARSAGMVFQNELANGLQRLGVEIEACPRNAWSFRVAGIPLAAEQEFSQRRKQILEELAKQMASPEDRETINRIARETRAGKKEPPFDALVQVWKMRALPFGLTPERVQALTQGNIAKDALRAIDAPALFAELVDKESVFERKGAFCKIAEATAKAGGLTRAKLNEMTDRFLADSKLIADLGEHEQKQGFQQRAARRIFSTPQQVEIEAGLAQDYEDSQMDKAHALTQAQIATGRAVYEAQRSAEAGAPVALKTEQEAVLQFVASAGRQCLIDGWAGTGKSFTMGAIREAYELAGYLVIGAAPYGTQADALKDGAKLRQAHTVASLLIQVQNGQIKPDAKTVLIVDEAGTLGSRDARAIQKAFPESKIVFLGDYMQYQSISAGGGWMRAMRTRFSFAKLTEITRQRGKWHIEAVKDFMNGNAKKALKAFEERDLLKVAESGAAAIKQMAADHIDDPLTHQNKLMIASTNRAVRALNEEARQLLIGRGELGSKPFLLTISEPLGPTHEMEMRTGERVRFRKNNKKLGIRNNQTGTVESIRDLRTGGHELVILSDEGKRFTARTEGPEAYPFLTWGYARSGHASQGLTSERARVLAQATQLHASAAYVTSSRSKGDTTIYTSEDDAPELARSMSRVRLKGWTLDYLKKDSLQDQQQAETAKTEPTTSNGPREILRAVRERIVGHFTPTRNAVPVAQRPESEPQQARVRM